MGHGVPRQSVGVHAEHDYIACMQYTLRDVPPALDRALRALAKREGVSLNKAALRALARALGVAEQPIRHRTLTDLSGTWHDDPEFDAAIEDQQRIDDALWS